MEAAKYNLPSQSMSEDFLSSKDSQAVLVPNVNFSLDAISKDMSEHSNGDIEGTNSPETLNTAVKSMSPTIIEHAFNVMKNLFSPDKSKSKPTGVANIIVNPVKPQQNSFETSPASVLVQTDSLNSPQSIGVGVVDGVANVSTSISRSSKDEMNHLGTILSPHIQDVLNNTDDSFLTTVSLIDESFQSAITHIDGNGEGLKVGSNPAENFLNDSRDLNVSDLSNDSFEGNDQSLENTLLKNGSMDQLDSESNGSREGNLETLNSTQIVNCHDKGPDEKVPTVKFSEPLKENRVNRNSSVHLDKHLDLGNDKKVDGVLKEVAIEEVKSVDLDPVETCENVQMENLFLNGRFENTQNEAEASKSDLLVTSGNTDENPQEEIGEIHLLGAMRMDGISATSDDDYTRTNISVLESGGHVQVDISFSTATVILENKESNEFDNDRLRLSLTEDEIDENCFPSSLSSPCTKVAPSSEAKNKPPQILSSSPHIDKKSTPVKNIKSESKKPNSIVKSPSKKASKSERSSPNKSPKAKNRLNKSADESSPTQSHDLPNQKPNSKVKESLGKNAQSSPIISPTKEIPDGNRRKEQTAEVISQESYTILNAPEILERPVIQSSKDLVEERKTSCDVKIDRPKQRERRSSACDEAVTPKLDIIKPEKLDIKAPIATASPELKPTSAVNEEPTEFSPVTPIMDHTFAFESSSEREGANSSQYQCTALNSTWVKSSKPTNEMNQTYDKKQETPKILNQTYDKSADSVTMNATFDKEPVLKAQPQPQPQPEVIEMNKTFDKEQDSIKLVSIQATIKEKSSDASTIQINLANNTGVSETDSNLPSHDVDSIIRQGSEMNNLNEITRQFSTMNLKEASSPSNVDFLEDQLDSSFKLQCDPDLVQLIQEQFTSTDIEKICSVVDDISSMKLSSQIMKASEQFDKSFHENFTEVKTPPGTEAKPGKPVVNPLSPQSFDFLNSITGKPTGRDLSRESLYVKFDPLVQPPNANSLIDFSKEADILPTIQASPEMRETGGNVCEQLLAISPEKKPDDIVPPLTPLSHKIKINAKEDKIEKLKELQNEIFFLRNLYAEREKANKAKMEDYENRVAKLTGENCVLEEKLKESSEREKCLVRKLNEQSQGMDQLKVIMQEYVKVIKRLTEELETIRAENAKQVETLTSEKDSYLTHLQNTEAAFTDVHAKYEKSKKTILNLKANESLYKATLVEQAAKLEEFIDKAREAQEKATTGFQKFQVELEELKGAHAQETTRLRAQLRKTELKLEAMQESLDQKIKENEQLTAICDELIEGKK